MKIILSPTDFSQASKDSSKYAAALAKFFNAELILIYAYTEPLILGELPPEELMLGQELHKVSQEAVDREAKYLSDNYNIIVWGAARLGEPPGVINSAVKDYNIDLIVMGMKGAARSHTFFGSTTVATLRKADVPVLVIPEGVNYIPIRNITLAADFKPETNMACLIAMEEFVLKYHASLNVLHIQKKKEQMEVVEMIGKLSINNLLDKFNPTYFDVENSAAGPGILNFINTHPTDLLAVISHHHNFFERLFGMEHTPSISYRTPLPMLVLHDKTY